jgi:hypothetical protein
MPEVVAAAAQEGLKTEKSVMNASTKDIVLMVLGVVRLRLAMLLSLSKSKSKLLYTP